MTRRTRTTAALAIGAVALLAAAPGAQDASPAPALTALDYFEIQQLNERYVHAIDNCIENGYEYASLYTRDGVFVDLWSEQGVTEGGIRWQGPAKLMEVSGGGVNGCKGWQRRSDNISYMITGLVITPSPEGVEDTNNVIGFYRSLPQLLESLPRVRSASATNALPLSGGDAHGELAIEGHAFAPGRAPSAS